MLFNSDRTGFNPRSSYTKDSGARSVMFIVVGNGHGDTRVQIQDEISHSTNTLEKGMNPIILPPAMGK